MSSTVYIYEAQPVTPGETVEPVASQSETAGSPLQEAVPLTESDFQTTPFCHHKPPQKRFRTDYPNNTTFFIQPGYDFFRNTAGIVEPGVSFAKTDDGNYTFTGSGPMTGWSPGGEFTLGIDFRRYAPYLNEKHPHKKLYEQKGPRFTLATSFGKYDLDYYQFSGTASTQQLQEKWGLTEYQLAQAGWQLSYGDISGVVSLLDVIPALWGNYDFTEDFSGEYAVVDSDIHYTRTGGTFWMGSSVYNASTPINVLESAHLGISGNFMTLGRDPYLGLGLAAETSLLRISPKTGTQHLRGDLILNASANYYRGVDFTSLGNSEFWKDAHLVEAQTGVAFRITTDVPSVKDMKHAAKTTVSTAEKVSDSIETGVERFVETSKYSSAEFELWDAPAEQGQQPTELAIPVAEPSDTLEEWPF